MKKIEINKIINAALLSEELFSRFPGWRSIGIDGLMQTEVILNSKRLIYPDDTDENSVLEVINAHDPSRKSRNQEARDTIVVDFAELSDAKDKILGNAIEKKVQDAIDAGDFKFVLKFLVSAIFAISDILTKTVKYLRKP